MQLFLALLFCLTPFSLESYSKQENYWPIYVKNTDEGPQCQTRHNFFGPIVESTSSCNEEFSTFRPLFTYFQNKKTGEETFHALYPFLTVRENSRSRQVNILNLIQYGSYTGFHPENPPKRSAALLPFFVYKNTGDPETSYHGVFPFAGGARNYLGADALAWSWFPLYLGVQKGDTVRHGMPWPFIQWQTGPCSGGAGLFPLFGKYWRQNDYEQWYALWPLIYYKKDKLNCEHPRETGGFLPFYAYERSENRNSDTVIWPFFGKIRQKCPEYREDHLFWPFFVQGCGEEKKVNRWIPFYSYSENFKTGKKNKWVFWPLFHEKTWEEKGFQVEENRLLYFLVYTQRQRNLSSPEQPIAEKTHVWPLYSYWDNGGGQKQFQFISPLEPFFPANRAVRKTYSPLFALYRYSSDGPGSSYHSLLFDLISVKKSPENNHFALGPLLEYESSCDFARFQLLKGLIGLEKKNGKNALRFLWMTI